MQEFQRLIASGFCAVSVLAVASLLAGCGSAPRTAPAATVNGEAITTQQLAAETPPGASAAPDARNRLLDGLVNRKLLSQEALRRKLDGDAETKLALERTRELVLADALSRDLAGHRPKPGAAEVDAYVKAHPAMFGVREILLLDQIRVPAAAVNGDWLRPANTLDEAAAILRTHKVAFERGRSSVDTATLPPAILQYVAEHPSDPFAFPEGDKLLISAVAGRQPAPVPAAQAHDVAVAAMQRQAIGQMLTDELATLRKDGKVTYVPGFAAPPAR